MTKILWAGNRHDGYLTLMMEEETLNKIYFNFNSNYGQIDLFGEFLIEVSPSLSKTIDYLIKRIDDLYFTEVDRDKENYIKLGGKLC